MGRELELAAVAEVLAMPHVGTARFVKFPVAYARVHEKNTTGGEILPFPQIRVSCTHSEAQFPGRI